MYICTRPCKNTMYSMEACAENGSRDQHSCLVCGEPKTRKVSCLGTACKLGVLSYVSKPNFVVLVRGSIVIAESDTALVTRVNVQSVI